MDPQSIAGFSLSHSVLKAEIDKLGYSGVGRKYGVSDNAVRKWLKAYERGNG